VAQILLTGGNIRICFCYSCICTVGKRHPWLYTWIRGILQGWSPRRCDRLPPRSPCAGSRGAVEAVDGQWCRSSGTGSRPFPSSPSELKSLYKQLRPPLPFFFLYMYFYFLEQIKERSPASLSWQGGRGSASRAKGVATPNQEMGWKCGPCTFQGSLSPAKEKGPFWTVSSAETHRAGLVCKYSI